MSAPLTREQAAQIGDVLDTREVCETADGGRMEWRLLVVDDEGGEAWKPYEISGDGGISEPLWMPLPGSQLCFLQCPVFECLFHGTRGPGKTETLLMDFARDVGRGYGSSWRGILFRREYKDLDDVVKKCKALFRDSGMFPGAKFLESKSEYKVVFPDGEELLLRHLADEKDYDNYHGHEYPWLGFEELTQWENDKPFKKMQSCCRSSRPGIFCRVRSTTNPYGVGHNWVKRRYGLPDMDGRIIRKPGEMPRVAIRGHLSENFILLHATPSYPITIKNSASNEAEAEAWINGSWDVTAGGMIDDLWRSSIHVIPDITADMIPSSWIITRAYDHGQSHPFAVGWWLESSGEPIRLHTGYDANGEPVYRTVGNVRGDLILWMEWYGCKKDQDNVGVRMSAGDIARGILDREDDEGVAGRVQPGPADTEIWTKDNRGTRLSPADDMENEGLYWDRADKSQGSRKRGWERLREYLRGSVPDANGYREKPGLFVCQCCRHWLALVPPMPRDTDKDLDDVPKTYEDHLADMTRYRVSWELPGMWRRGF